MVAIDQIPGNECHFEEAEARLQKPGILQHGPVLQVETVSKINRPYARLRKIRITTPGHCFNAYMKQYLLKAAGAEHVTVMQSRVEKDFTATTTAAERFAAVGSRLCVQQPIACFPDLMMVIFEESRGDNFQSLIQQQAYGWPTKRTMKRLIEYCEQCGEWLRQLQDLFPVDVSFDLAVMWDYLDQRLQRLVISPNTPFNEATYSQIQRYFEALAAQSNLLDLRMSATHADFFPGNVLVDPSGVTVIDLAMFTESSVYHDLAQFYHQLALLRVKPIFRPGVIDQLQDAFLKGYDRRLNPRNPMFEAFQLQHITTHLHRLHNLRELPIYERWYNRRVNRFHQYWITQQLTTKKIFM